MSAIKPPSSLTIIHSPVPQTREYALIAEFDKEAYNTQFYAGLPDYVEELRESFAPTLEKRIRHTMNKVDSEPYVIEASLGTVRAYFSNELDLMAANAVLHPNFGKFFRIADFDRWETRRDMRRKVRDLQKKFDRAVGRCLEFSHDPVKREVYLNTRTGYDFLRFVAAYRRMDFS